MTREERLEAALIEIRDNTGCGYDDYDGTILVYRDGGDQYLDDFVNAALRDGA